MADIRQAAKLLDSFIPSVDGQRLTYRRLTA